MEYSIVISAFNEADKISSTLTQIVNFMRGFSSAFEVVIVDDGSADNTAQIVSDYKRENKEVVLIKNPHMGKGPGISTGVKKAKGKYIYLADADLSTPISELKKLSVWLLDHDYDIVIASREGRGAERVDEPFYRHFMGRGFNTLVQLLVLPGIKDSQCGFKLFRGDVAKRLFDNLEIGTSTKELKAAYTGAWDVEILYMARLLGYNIKEVPIKWIFVKTTRISPIRDSIKMFKEILHIKKKALLGKYNTL
jgi:dolichyl-phosphate beta-glucosyltransferase